ncbi:CAP domain-containing protein [Legionella anisa]|uniref:CAP domain-containing protein n=1 Tax=Legionella anisa TaxID=28082 RepID=A0AAX0WSJ5_9GAMM|nr:CAP domain-containing protein [Legionella anisa]AWN75005.1 CAP domain-containing protein [Legionella anisa]KTC67348.1 putative transporter [Legionella anisa]MCW8424792.1 CAP domain-containing protein [Legionella anisa]MCW8446089.1 CAP domain-containing protein [Legionella anisa]PNL61040.1 CAP domain-containing protein [Legionella anisa]
MSLKTKIIIISSIIFSLLPCAYAASAAKHVDSDTAMQNAVLFYINEYRQKHGLSKLTMDNHMVIQARQHSQDMANHRMPFGHQDFGKRIAKLRSQIKNTGGAAENVAYNYKTAQIVVSQWVKSPGHRRNIVGNYNLTGIGIARDKQGKLYYTQIFLQTGKSPRSYTARRPYVGVPFFGIKRQG